MKYSAIFIVVNTSLYPVYSCYIWGTDSGECSLLTLDPVWRGNNMPFCGNAVLYPACIPKYQGIAPNRDFPDGRWINSTVSNKDTWIKENAIQHISERIGYERNRTLKNTGRNEYGDVGITKVRFYDSPDCENAYKNYFCWINFPRCDYQTDITLPTCRSACENFFKSCNYDNDLWRCGSSQFFNGYAPESPGVDASSGNATYLRDYFPGQPFVGNKFQKSGDEVPICTPALKGASIQFQDRRLYTFLAIFLSFFVSVTLLFQTL